MTSAMPWWAALVSGILLTCCLALAIPRALRHLPEPHPDTPGALTKPAYRDLAGLRFVLSTALLGGLGFALAAGTQPASQLAPWLVLSSGGLLAVAIDAVTTWIPRHLTYLCWAALVISFPVVGALGSWGAAARMALGALAAAALFWLIWRITSAGIGFGDVLQHREHRAHPEAGALLGRVPPGLRLIERRARDVDVGPRDPLPALLGDELPQEQPGHEHPAVLVPNVLQVRHE